MCADQIRFRPLTAALAMAALGAGWVAEASAQISFEARTRFALGHGPGAVPLSDPIFITEPTTIDLTLQMGIFNASGFTNYGVGFWSGTIFSSEPALSRPSSPRVGVFDGPVGYDGNINEEGTRIGLSGERLVEPTRGHVITEYGLGDPVPGPPGPVGVEEYVDLYQFSITITDLTTEREIVIRAEGVNWPIEGFGLIINEPPTMSELGFTLYAPDPAGPGTTDAQPADASVITLMLVPSPGASMIGAIFGLCAIRRRR